MEQVSGEIGKDDHRERNTATDIDAIAERNESTLAGTLF